MRKRKWQYLLVTLISYYNSDDENFLLIHLGTYTFGTWFELSNLNDSYLEVRTPPWTSDFLREQFRYFHNFCMKKNVCLRLEAFYTYPPPLLFPGFRGLPMLPLKPNLKFNGFEYDSLFSPLGLVLYNRNWPFHPLQLAHRCSSGYKFHQLFISTR